MIEPTIGRVVWFYPHFHTPGDQPQSASIAFVHHDRLINVGGFDHSGRPFDEQDVVLVQEGDPVPERGPYATWMPYQQAQAKK